MNKRYECDKPKCDCAEEDYCSAQRHRKNDAQNRLKEELNGKGTKF